MKNMNPMSSALRNRKARGIDLNIIIGAPGNDMSPESSKQEQADLGLAPDAEKVGNDEAVAHPDESQDKVLMQDEIAKAMGRGSLAQRSNMKKP